MKLLRYFAGLLVFLLATTVTPAQHYEAGDIHIQSPWARALPPTSPNGAVYLTLTNHGAHPDKLLGASPEIAERVEVHSHIHRRWNDEDASGRFGDPAPHEDVLFAPGGQHIMLIGLKQPLAVGDRFSLLLTFEQTEQTLVQVVVQMADTQGAGQTRHKHDETGSVAANDPGPVKRFELYIQHGRI